jgi:hypothetical protein
MASKYVLEDCNIEEMRAHKTDTFTKGCGKRKENIDDGCEACHQLVITAKEFVECLRLPSKDFQDGIARIGGVVAIVDLE